MYVLQAPLPGPPVAGSPPLPRTVSQVPVEIKRRVSPFGIAALALGIVAVLSFWILSNRSPIRVTINRSPVYITNYVAADPQVVAIPSRPDPADNRNATAETLPIDPQNRIVGRNLYRPGKSTLWTDMATNIVGNAHPRRDTYAPPDASCSIIKVVSVGKIPIVCDVFKQLYDDGGTYGVYHGIGDEYVKTILIYHHPKHAEITTGTLIYSSHERRGETPFTVPFLSVRVENWNDGNGGVLEAYDCGLPDTADNRKGAGIPVPPK